MRLKSDSYQTLIRLKSLSQHPTFDLKKYTIFKIFKKSLIVQIEETIVKMQVVLAKFRRKET